jgi:hypothetical protein
LESRHGLAAYYQGGPDGVDDPRFQVVEDIEMMELSWWVHGRPSFQGTKEAYRIVECEKFIGVSDGDLSKWIRVQRTPDGQIHGRPISEPYYKKPHKKGTPR